MAVYSLSCSEITEELVAAKKRGVALRIISDVAERLSVGSDVQALLKNGISVKANKENGGLMHHKVLISLVPYIFV